MQHSREITEKGMEALQQAGLEKSECTVSHSRKVELNLDSGEFSLLRTNEGISMTLTGIIDDREGSVTINRIDDETISSAAGRVMEMAGSSEPDPANDISPPQPEAQFEKGPESPDRDLMYERMKEFLMYVRSTYPSLILEQAILDFSRDTDHYMNSNGVDLTAMTGAYSFVPMFTSKEGTDISSFNYTGISAVSLDRPLHELGTLDELMRQSTEQVRSVEFREKFKGDLLITPDCLRSLIYMICMYLQDYPMIRGTSIFKDSLDTRIAYPGLTLRSMPTSDELASGYFITGDGFPAEDSIIIEKGILKTFLLSLYGANKTGRERAVNEGGAFVVDPGEDSPEEMISSVSRGIMLCRFSGGMPSESGDFSGVAKNSYYISDGSIQHPVKEIMISGNIRDLLNNIRSISRKRIDFGDSILPWILAGDISIFGK